MIPYSTSNTQCLRIYWTLSSTDKIKIQDGAASCWDRARCSALLVLMLQPGCFKSHRPACGHVRGLRGIFVTLGEKRKSICVLSFIIKTLLTILLLLKEVGVERVVSKVTFCHESLPLSGYQFIWDLSSYPSTVLFLFLVLLILWISGWPFPRTIPSLLYSLISLSQNVTLLRSNKGLSRKLLFVFFHWKGGTALTE